MSNTLGIHWAATTHGTWLHGDPRGSWRNGKLIGPDPYLEAETRARMSHDAVALNAVERSLIAKAFGIVVEERNHRVFAATVQATHVHLVLGPLDENLDTVIARLKRRSAAAVLARRRELCKGHDSTNPAKMAGESNPARMAGVSNPARMAGLYSRAILARSLTRWRTVPRSLWTAGKFPIFIFDEDHLFNAIEYVRDHNRRNGLPADPFGWIDPLYPPGELAGERCYRSSLCEEPRW